MVSLVQDKVAIWAAPVARRFSLAGECDMLQLSKLATPLEAS